MTFCRRAAQRSTSTVGRRKSSTSAPIPSTAPRRRGRRRPISSSSRLSAFGSTATFVTSMSFSAAIRRRSPTATRSKACRKVGHSFGSPRKSRGTRGNGSRSGRARRSSRARSACSRCPASKSPERRPIAQTCSSACRGTPSWEPSSRSPRYFRTSRSAGSSSRTSSTGNTRRSSAGSGTPSCSRTCRL